MIGYRKKMSMNTRCLYSCMWLTIVSLTGFMFIVIFGNLHKAHDKFIQDDLIVNAYKSRFYKNMEMGNNRKTYFIDPRFNLRAEGDAADKMPNANKIPDSDNNIKADIDNDIADKIDKTDTNKEGKISDKIDDKKAKEEIDEPHRGVPKVDKSRGVGSNEHRLSARSNRDHTFYKMRPTKVNEFNFKFHHSGKNICKENDPPFLVIVCLSTYYDIETRQTIRETWGSVVTSGMWPRGKTKLPTVKLVFLFGGPEDTVVKKAILEDEENRFGDIVMADFKDSYANLTYKVMMGLKWANMYCKDAKYFVKIDQDMFLHVQNMIYYLKKVEDSDPGVVVGYVNSKAKVYRSGIWGLSTQLFPLRTYPNYTNGNTYVISGKAVGLMLEAAERMPYIFIEDAFLTGIVRTVVGLKIIDHQGFARWADPPPRLCSFYNDFRIASTNTDDKLKRTLWKAMHYRNLKNCYHPVKRHQT